MSSIIFLKVLFFAIGAVSGLNSLCVFSDALAGDRNGFVKSSIFMFMTVAFFMISSFIR